MGELPLRPLQASAIDRLRESLRSHKRPVLMAPTGAGKTRIASEVIKMARAKDKRVVFCVPALCLIDQTLEAFWRDGISDIGVIQAKHVSTDWQRPVQVASVQTLARRGSPDCDLVIVDECHRVFDAQTKWMAAKRELPFIGLSATPWTKGLGKHYDDLIISATTQSLIDQGLLSPFKVFAPAHPDLRGVKTVAGDYHEGQLSEAMNKAPLVADVVETWIARGENRSTLVFGVDRAHAKHLQQRFLEAGINAGYQDMATSDHERRDIKGKFHDGTYPVVCNVGTLTLGVDWDVRCIVLARPTRSEILYVQIIGRGLRTGDGKSDLVVLDHSDTTLRLGFVTDIHHDHLDDGEGNGKAKAPAPLPKECPKCSYLMPPRTNPCPACGHRRGPPINTVENVDGELIELSSRPSRAAPRLSAATTAVIPGYVCIGGMQIPHREFYGELRGIGEERGYSAGWAAHQYREKAGEWPDRLWHREEPSQAVRSWVRSRMIRYAKGRAKHETAGRLV